MKIAWRELLPSLPVGVDLSAYRIVQEALTNVIKHAGGTTARACVQVTYRPHDVDVTVSDDGSLPVNGGAVTRCGGHGLINIRERVAVVGGTVEAGPGPGGGFVVRAHLPYSVEPGSAG